MCLLRRCRYGVDNNNTPEQAGGDEPHRQPRGIQRLYMFLSVCELRELVNTFQSWLSYPIAVDCVYADDVRDGRSAAAAETASCQLAVSVLSIRLIIALCTLCQSTVGVSR